jgi:hypothetical protein
MRRMNIFTRVRPAKGWHVQWEILGLIGSYPARKIKKKKQAGSAADCPFSARGVFFV